MATVNYVREHIRFMEYAADEGLTSGERLLWFALMHVINRHARGSDWPEDYVRISNARLMAYCPMKYDTLAKAREALRRRGLIDYREGERNRRPPAYRVHYFSLGAEALPDPIPGVRDVANDPAYDPEYPDSIDEIPIALADDPACDLQCYPEISDSTETASAFDPEDLPHDPQCYPKKSDNIGDNIGVYRGDIYINYTDKPELESKPGVPREEEEKTIDRSRGNTTARVREGNDLSGLKERDNTVPGRIRERAAQQGHPVHGTTIRSGGDQNAAVPRNVIIGHGDVHIAGAPRNSAVSGDTIHRDTGVQAVTVPHDAAISRSVDSCAAFISRNAAFPHPAALPRDACDRPPRSPADTRSSLAQCWREAFGRDPTPAALDLVVHRGITLCALPPALLREAIRMAALRCADSPVDYMLTLFRDWRRRGIRTPEELDDYLEERAS